MEAQQVIEKILAEANAEAEKLKKQAQEKEAAEQAKLDGQLSQFNEQTETLAQKAAEDEKSHVLAAARMDIAKQLLAEKGKILDEVFTQSSQQLQQLPDDQYRQLITKLMLQAVETGEEQVILDKDEARIDQQLIVQVNQQLSANGKGGLKLSDQKRDLGGGFILSRGKIKTNVSFKVILDQARKDLEIDLAKEVFKN
jgi:V/A-type H+-transporting ATPase subunit E